MPVCLRPLSRKLSDVSYAWRQGNTDSETIFAVFIDVYMALKEESPAEKMADALVATIKMIEAMQKSIGSQPECDLNLLVTDGRSAVVSRYSSQGRVPNSLHVHTGYNYSCDSGDAKLTPSEEATVLVASEPLTEDTSWRSVEPNHIVVVNELLDVDIRPMNPTSV